MALHVEAYHTSTATTQIYQVLFSLFLEEVNSMMGHRTRHDMVTRHATPGRLTNSEDQSLATMRIILINT